MDKFIVTIARGYGSGGRKMGKLLAKDETIKQLKAEAEVAEKKQAEATGKVDKLTKQLKAAKDAERTAKDALQVAKEHPEIPEAMMEEMRQQVAADAAAKAVFGAGSDDSNMPTFELSASQIEEGLNIVDLLSISGLAPSKGEGRRLVQQGGVSIDGKKVDDIAYVITKDIFNDDKIVVKKGKKVFLKVVIS